MLRDLVNPKFQIINCSYSKLNIFIEFGKNTVNLISRKTLKLKLSHINE